MKKLVIAMDSFKGTLSSLEAGQIVKEAFLSVFPAVHAEVVCVADGGEGMVEAMMRNMGGTLRTAEVSDSLGRPVRAAYGIAGETAVIEMAAASGLPLLTEAEYDPLRTTTYGTGELIRHALDEGAKRIIVGLGGSATNDGGAGMAQALGVRLKDTNGREIEPGGGALDALSEIDLSGLDPRLGECEIIAACDVKNPLCGKNGATYVYGPQKGVCALDAETLDNALKRFAALAEQQTKSSCSLREGAGAAGGLGFGMMVFLHAKVQPGIETVLACADMEQRLSGADLLITGEGCIDAQTANGKTPVGVAACAKGRMPVIAIAGQVKPGFEAVYAAGICAVLSCVNRIMTMDEVRGGAKEQLYGAAQSAARLIKTGGACCAR